MISFYIHWIANHGAANLGRPIMGLPISELAETAELSLKHPLDAVANQSLPPPCSPPHA
ncbi:MAG: hypothetical protein PHH43_01515 [Candidatus Cloacimonetes bacterium]|nr:hypothetical protein [Candidatus Cloacimonadota bacterium]MDD3234986.1 hypothetical protein [Candidatus Cloacimonadota bacterium]